MRKTKQYISLVLLVSWCFCCFAFSPAAEADKGESVSLFDGFNIIDWLDSSEAFEENRNEPLYTTEEFEVLKDYLAPSGSSSYVYHLLVVRNISMFQLPMNSGISARLNMNSRQKRITQFLTKKNITKTFC